MPRRTPQERGWPRQAPPWSPTAIPRRCQTRFVETHAAGLAGCATTASGPRKVRSGSRARSGRPPPTAVVVTTVATVRLLVCLVLRAPAVEGEQHRDAVVERRRMRDSNPRGLAPNPLSKSALAGSGALADVLQAWLEGR